MIETPQGFALIAAKHIDRGTSRPHDLAQVYQVSFHTHDAEQFSEFYFQSGYTAPWAAPGIPGRAFR